MPDEQIDQILERMGSDGPFAREVDRFLSETGVAVDPADVRGIADRLELR
ncbi:MAG: hypothetical protein GY946_16790, partial [bacterium]|nr:hypothetical protein [bacterium]